MNIEEEQKEEIPADVCALQILPIIPANHLLTLKTVCKNWLHLITSPYFVRLHLSRSIIRTRVLLITSPWAIVEYNIYYREAKQIPYPPKLCSPDTKIAGSADGLVCLLDHKVQQRWKYDEPVRAAIYNPSTRRCLSVGLISLPKRAVNFIMCYWFGNLGGEYILVLGLLFWPFYECAVYTFTPNTISRVHSIPVEREIGTFDFILEERGTFVHGVVYWPVLILGTHYSISAYHIHNNKHWEILPPAQCDFRLGVVDGCMCAVLKSSNMSVFELWIMKEESWTKYANIEGVNNIRVLSPLGFLPNGDIILDADKTQLIKYRFKDNEPVVLGVYGPNGGDVEAIVCADSLVSPPFI